MQKVLRVIARRHIREVDAVLAKRGSLEGGHIGGGRSLRGVDEMPFLVEHGGGEILRGGITLIELLRRQYLVQQLLRHGRAGLVVLREVRHDDRLASPHLVVLRRILDEVPGHRRAGEQRVVHVRQHSMNRVTKLMEQRGHFVESEQRRPPGLRLRDVEVVGHDRLEPEQPRLPHEAAHPGAALFVVAREIVTEE